ncbi:kinase-like domain-containing protein [Aspergillus germanicus]
MVQYPWRSVDKDIQTKNIMLGIEDESILTDSEEAEKANPNPRRVSGDRTIYSSRTLGIPKILGRPVLADFGETRFISTLGRKWENVQPLIYRAPEVVLRMPWDHKIDIWNLGVLAWDLFETGLLFYARDKDKNDSDRHHLAEMMAIFGPPPKDIFQSEYATRFYNDQGNWTIPSSFDGCVPNITYATEVRQTSTNEIPTTPPDRLKANLQGEKQALFLRFMRKMVQWRPEDRASAKELLRYDPECPSRSWID